MSASQSGGVSWRARLLVRGGQEAVTTTQTRSKEGLRESSGFWGEDSGVHLRTSKEVEASLGGEWGMAAVEGKEPETHSSIHSHNKTTECLLAAGHSSRHWACLGR